jgi:hypothetical protein
VIPLVDIIMLSMYDYPTGGYYMIYIYICDCSVYIPSCNYSSWYMVNTCYEPVCMLLTRSKTMIVCDNLYQGEQYCRFQAMVL